MIIPFEHANRQPMHELILNLHMHSTYSDGSGTYADIGRAALKAGIDAVIVTDHNVLVNGLDQYYKNDTRCVLLMTGEEIHDPCRESQKNHLLVFGAGQELSQYATHPQQLIDQAAALGGLTFIAHPFEVPLPIFGEEDISWVDWNVQGYTGIELWNGFSEFKSVIHSSLEAIFYAFFPQFVARSPANATLQKWDELLTKGLRVVAIGGTDAHALLRHLGPIQRIVFPYEFHFRTINTHLIVPNPLSGDLVNDRRMILQAMQEGHAFIGYDLPASTKGFRFSAQSKEQLAILGDTILLNGGVTFQIKIPSANAECRLIKDGEVIKRWKKQEICTYIASQPGVYRVECYIQFLGLERGWIFSNPIYVREP